MMATAGPFQDSPFISQLLDGKEDVVMTTDGTTMLYHKFVRQGHPSLSLSAHRYNVLSIFQTTANLNERI